MTSTQLLRGRTYTADGAIHPEQLDAIGGFPMDQDESCWHLLLVDDAEDVIGCVRYLIHDPTVQAENLHVSRSALALDPRWAPALRHALDSELKIARENKLAFLEIGGWAIAPDYRCTRAALEVLLASFAFARILGGAVACCTATVRNNSASILRRIGAKSLSFENEEIPPYEDPKYGCVMEVLRFHFACFDPRYRKVVEDLQYRLINHSNVIVASEKDPRDSDVVGTSSSLHALRHALDDFQPAVTPLVNR